MTQGDRFDPKNRSTTDLLFRFAVEITRGILRKIAEDETSNLGDIIPVAVKRKTVYVAKK